MQKLLALAGVAVAVTVFVSADDQATRGKALFESRCTGCHALDANKEGPRLRGVYGRTAGTASSFTYSDGLSKSGIVWNAQSLDKWLTDPENVVPDADMAFRLPDAAARAAVIEYLKTLR